MDQAFPAQLERLLRTKGCSAEVLNAGVAGDTTGGMLARLPGLLSANTRVLILQPGSNDAAPGNNASSRSSNIADIRKYSAEHGVNVIQLHNIDRVVGDHWTGEHPDAEGQAAIAKWLFPRVLQTGVCSPVVASKEGSLHSRRLCRARCACKTERKARVAGWLIPDSSFEAVSRRLRTTPVGLRAPSSRNQRARPVGRRWKCIVSEPENSVDSPTQTDDARTIEG